MINLIFRKTGEFVSIEMVFNTVEQALENRFLIERKFAPTDGVRIRSIFKNLMWARALREKTVNHVTGDIHYLCLALRRESTVLTIHDIRILNELSGLRRAIIKYFWFSMPLKRAKYVTVISEETKKELVNEIPSCEAKIHIIPNSYNPAFQPSPYQFNSVKPKILHVGTTDNKNLERVIEALTGISCELIILGKLNAKQVEFLENSKIDYDARTGLSLQQVVELYQMVDLVCFVSLYEGFGMPIIEAQAVGRPVMTSNLSSMPAVAGTGALLIDPYRVEEIREGILRLINERGFREELVKRGYRNIERFAQESVTKQYAILYEKIASDCHIQIERKQS